MKVLVDENIPYVYDLFSHLGGVTATPGCPVPVAQLVDTDVLMVCSATKVNEPLLAGKPIKFVGTTTAGTDHIDEAWLRRAGISFSTAPDCNAIVVVEYVFSSLLMLAERDRFSLHECIVGIIGVGNVDHRLQARLEALGIKALLCDPSRTDRGDEGDLRLPDKLVQHADILTFHTPLSKDGLYKTLHLADERLIRSLKPGAILTNAHRGAVVDNTALLACLSEGQRSSVMLNAQKDEPELNVELLKKADIDTPHIAGYTLEDKARGITQVLEAYNKFIGHEQHVAPGTLLSASEFGRIALHDPLDQSTLERLVHLVYDARRDDAPLHKVTGISGEFDKLYKNYLERRE